VEVLFPRNRVPLSFAIDDSTCLVNMGRFCMPQFASAWPKRADYRKPWRDWPREIPDAFVREFGAWCAANGIKGKYSVVPWPACVGRLDRELPGWTNRQLADSLKLVREVMLPNWDVHPEMITHTRVVDIETGKPVAAAGPDTFENWYPPGEMSADALAAYMAYALRILRNCGLNCEGITSPGGFGNRVRRELSLAVHDAMRDVFRAEVPHYLKCVAGGDGNTEPQVEHVRGLESGSPKVTVNVPAGTGDWFGGWDGDRAPAGHRYANDDATSGRMVELIEKRQPAVMLCHWPGLYSQGTKTGFKHFQRVAQALALRFSDETVWMKLSEIARYWAAKELTSIAVADDRVTLRAPFACPAFTVRVKATGAAPPSLVHAGKAAPLEQASDMPRLRPGTWLRSDDDIVLCFDLPKGETLVQLGEA
jgi:hypothetical protein